MTHAKHRHVKLTQWQITALIQLVREELARRADEALTPWISGVQNLEDALSGGLEITVTKEARR